MEAKLTARRGGERLYYGWVIVAAGFAIGFAGIGARYSYGVFLKSIESEFALSRGSTSVIFSVYMLLCCILAVAGGWALDRFGPKRVGVLLGVFTGLSFLLTPLAEQSWQLFITYSLLLSLGTGAIYGLVNTTVSRWFTTKRGLAIGITSSGGGVGAIATAPFASYLITTHGWRTAFTVLGVIAGTLMVGAALLLVKDPETAGRTTDGAAPGTQAHINFRNAFALPAFWYSALAWFLISFGLHMVFIHIVPYAVGLGVTALGASVILSLMGLLNILGRLVIGKLSDHWGPGRLGVACLLVQSAALMALWAGGGIFVLYGFGAVYGFMWGGAGTVITVLTSTIFGTRSLGSIMGVMSGAWAVGAACGPAVGGYVFDVTASYHTAFALAAAGLVAGAAMLELIRRETTARGANR